ncbi:hyaluronan / mRNA binding family domain-containing protein [Ditylenchus destructor]|nr:hyaluronan / mRNA binding family domain-containing protein [Ditylenchus destructor]
MEYGISTQNKFAFLGDDEEVTDPEEVLQRAEKESKEKPKTKDVKKPVPEKKVTVAPSANKENEDTRRPPRRDQRGGPGGFKGGPRGPRRSTGDENAPPGDVMSDRFGENRPRNQNRRSKEGDNAGRGNRDGWQKDRPPRQPRTGGENNVSDSDGQQVNRPPRGERPYRRGPRTGERGPARGDRQSGDPKSGVRPGATKKGGHGTGNWGTEQDELAGETQPTATTDDWGTSAPAATDDWGVPEATQEATQDTDAAAETEGNPVNGDEAEAEKINALTLQEWKAQQKLIQPQFKVRKAGEGDDQKIYQKLVPIKKEKVDKDAHTTEDEDEHQMKREPRERPLNIEICFNDQNRNKRDRDDRGPPRGDRGRGGRGGGPGPRRNPDAPSGSGRRQNQGQDWQPSNPQVRIFLPDFWIKLVETQKAGKYRLPKNAVKFEVDLRMSRYDVREYLEKIYKLPVRDVRTVVQQ